MRVAEYPTFEAATAAKGVDEIVASVTRAGRTTYGLLPAVVTVDTPNGERSQPIAEFLEGYWQVVESEAARRARTAT